VDLDLVTSRDVGPAADEAEDGPGDSPVVRPVVLLALLALHVPLALAMKAIPELATVHAVGALAVGVALALFGRRWEGAVCAAAYVTGAEVLWRMCYAGVFWEYGKYATSLILAITALRWRPIGAAAFPAVFFAQFVPSTLMTIAEVPWANARDDLSFNLSGPLALAVAVWCFGRLDVSRETLYRLFTWLIAPVGGIAALGVHSTATAQNLAFTPHSNPVTSGGFGPNQVAPMLALAALLLLFMVQTLRVRLLGLILVLLMLVFLTLSALTFSRGGLWFTGISSIVAAACLFENGRTRWQAIVIISVVVVTAQTLILPRLAAFTQGEISQRFGDTSLTGRDRLMEEELQVFLDHPLLGVGPGQAASRRVLGRTLGVAPHTEFTRTLAEHGFFGLVALVLLGWLGWAVVLRARPGEPRAVAATLCVWSALFMGANAMRLVVPSFLIGLACIQLSGGRAPDEDDAEDDPDLPAAA
jgi:O-antigen ligase